MSVESKEFRTRMYRQEADKSVKIYEQATKYIYDDWEMRMLRVAIYCRVSTDSDEQATSLALQTAIYNEYVEKHPNWILVDVYADEGISATSYKKRDNFNRMLKDCEDGKIDLIITKNVSRFSRNVVDCIGIARKLLHAKHKVGIFFQEQNINTLVHGNEMILTIMAAIAQAESNLKSESMLWSIAGRFQRGQFLTPTENLLGFYKDGDGKMQIAEEEAKTVRAIFKAFLSGCPISKIAFLLTFYRRPTSRGKLCWSASSVRGILINERMCGDVIAQKTTTTDVYSHRVVKNIGQKRSYYKRDHHPAIISRKDYVRALMLLKSKRNSPYFNPDYTIQVVKNGLLAGFIPVNTAFGGFSPAHYMGALEAAGITVPPVSAISGKVIDVKNSEITRIEEFSHSALANVLVKNKKLRFNRDCISFFGEEALVELLFHPAEQLLAVRRTNSANKNAVKWNTTPISAVHLCTTFHDLCGWIFNIGYQAMANYFVRGKEKLMMFSLGNAEIIVNQKMKTILEGKKGEKFGAAQGVWSFCSAPKDDFGENCPTHRASDRQWLALALDDWRIDEPAENVPGFEDFETFINPEELIYGYESEMFRSFTNERKLLTGGNKND